MEPFAEVLYSQEEYDPSIDYSKMFRFWTAGFKPDASWQALPPATSDQFATAVRIVDGYIQAISIMIHGASPELRLLGDDPIARQFAQIKELKPLTGHPEVEIYMGQSHRDPALAYLRTLAAPSPQNQNIGDGSIDLADCLAPLSMGFEDASDFIASEFVDGEWPVAYMKRIAQEEFEYAYRQLLQLRDWIREADAERHGPLEKFFLERIRGRTSESAP